MKIGIVAPSSVPFIKGGAENLHESLRVYLDGETAHDADLVALPSPEADFWSLMASYRAFSELDVSRFDLVISTKYPAWMIDHPRHVCYMLHRLRGVYDTYRSFGLPVEVGQDLPLALRELHSQMRKPIADRRSLSAFFDQVQSLRGNADCESYLALPSPMTRQIIHYLDEFGLRPGNVERHAAISSTVAKRADYFPSGVPVQVIHPPSGLQGLRAGNSEYVFTASRLDAPKRIDLIIEAFGQVPGDVKLKIAGIGPEEARLRQLAATDDRVEFLGYVDSAKLADLYADSLAVVFTPREEDLGYITIEAMLSSKPVLTVSDAGGPLEFVQDGRNGFISEPYAECLALPIGELMGNQPLAKAMGAQAAKDVAGISWAQVVPVLLGEKQAASVLKAREERKKIVVLSTFPVYPPVGGGQCRIFHMWRHVALQHDVVVVSSVATGQPFSRQIIAENMQEVCVPRTAAQTAYEVELARGLDWLPITDIAFAMSPELAEPYRIACQEALADADLCVASCPYTLPALGDMPLRQFWYDAQNHEASMKTKMLPDTEEGRRIVSIVRAVEHDAASRADRVIYVSDTDRKLIQDAYHVPEAAFLSAPNGVDLESVTFLPELLRTELRDSLALNQRPIAVILASWHGPNLEAVDSVLAIAPRFPNVDFMVVGSACSAIAERELPTNIHLLGVVSDEEKDVILALATLAVNPMRSGGGSNLKLLDYMASGVPVVTSMFGARGSDIDASMAWIYCDDEFEETFARAMSADAGERRSKSAKARRHVERRFSWKVISESTCKAV
jgi:glycosyltransferase involved in cell wall biosynthesis